jgi:hypothetical protein
MFPRRARAHPRWKVIFRAKKSPYFVGLQKRRGYKLPVPLDAAYIVGTGLDSRDIAMREFKRLKPWVVVLHIYRVDRSGKRIRRSIVQRRVQ